MMKKILIGLMLIVLIMGCSLSIYAAPGRFHGGHRKSYERPDHREREDGGYIIHRTSMIVFTAQRAGENGHHYEGFAQVIAHQQRARELYMQGSYREAIYHSLRAREFAIRII